MSDAKARPKYPPGECFYLKVAVKPYVKCWLENQYGNPVYFGKCIDDYRVLRGCLTSSRGRAEYKDARLNDLASVVTIVITPDDAARYGYFLSKAAALRFESFFELQIKTEMRIFVGVKVSIGTPVYIAVADFSKQYGYTEDCWLFETIKKDFYRQGHREVIDFDAIAKKLKVAGESISS